MLSYKLTKVNNFIKIITLQQISLHSPIKCSGIEFLGRQKSDRAGGLVYITKNALGGANFINGVRYCAIIGLIIMKILRS